MLCSHSSLQTMTLFPFGQKGKTGMHARAAWDFSYKQEDRRKEKGRKNIYLSLSLCFNTLLSFHRHRHVVVLCGRSSWQHIFIYYLGQTRFGRRPLRWRRKGRKEEGRQVRWLDARCGGVEERQAWQAGGDLLFLFLDWFGLLQIWLVGILEGTFCLNILKDCAFFLLTGLLPLTLHSYLPLAAYTQHTTACLSLPSMGILLRPCLSPFHLPLPPPLADIPSSFPFLHFLFSPFKTYTHICSFFAL